MSSKSPVKPLPWVVWALGGLLLVMVAGTFGAYLMLAKSCQAIPLLTGCAEVRLPADTLSGDFYDGEQLISTGVTSVTVSTGPGQVHRINVRRIVDNSYHPNDDFIYDDTMIEVNVPAGQTQTFVITPPKDYQKGQLRLVCDIKSEEVGDDVACEPQIDGGSVPDLAPGKSIIYPLDEGPHTVHVDLVGKQSDIWFPAASDTNFDVISGQVSTVTETFTRMTLLTVSINKTGVIGDLFLDGKLIGDQVSTATAYVKPNTSYTVVGSNFNDPDSKGAYRWNTVGATVKIGVETQKTLTLPMEKQDLTGVVKVTCKLSGFQTNQQVSCGIPVDGGDPVAQIAPGETSEIHVKPGVHTLTVKLSGADASKWSTPGPQRVSVKTGQATEVTFSSVLLSSITPTAAPPPTVPPKVSIPTLTPPPGQPVPPTFTPKPPSIYTGTLSHFGANARAIYQRGLALGRNPKKFSKVGDCETDSPYFLIPFDQGIYNLGPYTYLNPMIKNFAGSFGYHSVAGKGSFVVSSVLDPQWSDPAICQPGENPLACEYRTNNPSIALIMLRTYPYPWETANRDKYISDMRSVIDYTISQGIVPVLSTIPLIESSPDELHDMNNIIRQLAAEYDIPLWDFYATLSTLPNNGVDDTSHLTVPPDGGTTFVGDDMTYGMSHRNLETLEVLHDLSTNVMR